MKRISTLTATLALLVIAGCASPVDVGNKDATPIDSRGTGTQQPDGRAVAPVTASNLDALNDPKSPLYKKSVYFDLDSYSIKAEYQSLVEAHAKYLRENKSRRVSIEGNTDDRGSREYNLALGQKRAEAVKKALGLLGVGDTQVEAVSFGEEKPKAVGEDEAAWTENRRADIRYL
ncbi:peptidoglycan-associated lipoprotein Pal [soil metagenome]